jgi:hypothetical protein
MPFAKDRQSKKHFAQEALFAVSNDQTEIFFKNWPATMRAFDSVLRAAQRLSQALELRSTQVEEFADALRKAFPEGWLDSLRTRGKSQREDWFSRHPIDALLGPIGEQQLTTLLELGQYLHFFAETAGIETIETALKANSTEYYHAFLQLAFAYRFAAVGADVELEPQSVAGRRGDITFKWKGSSHVVECLRKPPRNIITPEMRYLQDSCSKMAAALQIPLRIDIQLHIPLRDGKVRKEISAQVQIAISELKKDLRSGIAQPGIYTRNRTDVAEVSGSLGERPRSVTDGMLLGMNPSDGEQVMRSSFARVLKLGNNEGESGGFLVDRKVDISISPPTNQQLEVKHTPENIPQLLSRITDQLESKLPQTRTQAGWGRLLLVESDVVRTLSGAADERLKKLAARIVEAHVNVAGVILVHRFWVIGARRWRYRVLPVHPSTRETALSGDFWGSIDDFEKSLSRL